MRNKLKCGGRSRRKALLGADGAIMAAATLAAAGINALATRDSARTQADATIQNAKTQAQSIIQQTRNNTELQKQSIAFTKEENKQNRDQQNDIQATLQLLAGQQNTNDRLRSQRVALKNGGKLSNINSSHSFYGGAPKPFTITDGGGAIPLSTDANGYGLYELYGNDHKHYHKTKSGKSKSGVGVKLSDGTVVEGEGNQNTNRGEKLFVTPTDAMFISKHSIKGFNPSIAVENGMNPIQAFNIQQTIKANNGIKDDGSRMKLPRRRVGMLGLDIINSSNQTQNIINNTAPVAAGIVYGTDQVKCGGHRKLKCGGRTKAEDGFWKNHAGATYAAAGNIGGALISGLTSLYAGNKMAKAYKTAGNILADAYGQMKGISMSELNKEDYDTGHVMAVVRDPNTNINPQLERLRRNASSESRLVNRNILSSAARQQRLSGINDRMYQRMGEQYAYKHNEDEKIMQANAERIQQASAQNAQLQTQSRAMYNRDRLNLLQYNNNIENAKIAGRAQALSDATVQSGMARHNGRISLGTSLGAGIAGAAQGFANSIDAAKKAERDYQNILLGADTKNQVVAVIARNDKNTAQALFDTLKIKPDAISQSYAQDLANRFGFDFTPINNNGNHFRILDV